MTSPTNLLTVLNPPAPGNINPLGPIPAGTVYAPRLMVTVGGVIIPNVFAASDHAKNTFEASEWSFDAVLPSASAPPPPHSGPVNLLNALNPAPSFTAAWWASQTQVVVKIYVAYEAAGITGWTRLVTGNTDDYEIDLDTQTINVSGRDLTSLFIDAKTATAYLNQTSSQVAALLAANHPAITATQITPTKTPVGTYYANDYSNMSTGDFSHATTEWDLLVYLAQNEGFDVFVDDTTLYFQPAQNGSGQPYTVPWQMGSDGIPVSPVMDLKLKHSLTQAPGVSVKIISWNSATASRVTATAKGAGYDPTGNSGQTQDYVFNAPNLSLSQAQALANQRLNDISRHMRIITFDAPGDVVLSPRSTIKLVGTGTPFDSVYYPDEIERTINAEEFTMSVTAKNIPASAQTVVG